MIEEIEFNGKKYPMFQSQGNASQFAIPFAKHFCYGDGYDIGCNRDEWKFPGAQAIDLIIDDKYDAFNLPDREVDYIFSSHCLEHLVDWVEAANLWTSKIKDGGTLFLYLPDYSQEYWRPWNNRKHVNVLTPEIIKDYMDTKYDNVFVSGIDLNNSFMAVGSKK